MDAKLLDKLSKRKKEGTFRSLTLVNSSIDFFSNDYLGLACEYSHEKSVVELTGATGSRLLSGNSLEADICEKFLANHFNAASSLVFNSGYSANLALLSSIPQRGDTILYDELVHASIRDGIRLSFANAVSFKHNDVTDLNTKLNASNGVVYVVVESLYSMNGDLSPLKEIVEICSDYSAFLIVDEAHSVGVFGKKGVGLIQELNLESKVFARVITFGKAYGFHGAAIVGSKDLVEFLINFARPFIYTTALPPQDYKTINDLVNSTLIPKNQVHLLDNINYFRKRLTDTNRFPSDLRSPIQIIQTNTIENTIELAESLKKNGIFTKPIFSPTVPIGKECIRICLHSFNTHSEIDILKELIN
jgi:8-amino-7-oxononanoate synthase